MIDFVVREALALRYMREENERAKQEDKKAKRSAWKRGAPGSGGIPGIGQ